MTFFGFLVLIHVVAAVAGLGASFAMPLVIKLPKTASQARFSLELNQKIEMLPKVGSIALLLTGLIMGFLNTALFTQIWYVASLVIYVLAQVIVIGLLPKKMKEIASVLETHEGAELPESYKTISKEIDPYNYILHGSAIILIILMSVKPF